MLLIDAIHRLNGEHEVRFLLSAYLENLRAHRHLHGLSDAVIALPLTDTRDVQARFAALLRAQWEADSAVTDEAAEIFGAAVTRLNCLRAMQEPDATPGRPPVPANPARELLFA